MVDDRVGEHFVPGTSRITEIESFHRYFAAAELCRDCCVLDAASGDGYGSAVLAKKARTVTGIDCNEDAVRNAEETYHAQNLEFVVGNVQNMPFPDASFERIVSFETIEHIHEPVRFLSEVRRVLKPDGILILSSPNKNAFDQRNHCANGENPYHVHEMERAELESLIRQFFPNISFYAQDAFYNSVISGDGGFCCYVRDKNGELLTQSGLEMPQYTILCASAGELPKNKDSIFVDAVFDSAYGYCFDDEAVVNQFGLRGEFEKLQKDFQGQQKQMSETLLELNNCRDNLDKAHTELQEGEEKRKALQSDFDKVYTELQNSEEHRKYMLSDLDAAHTKLQNGEEKRKALLDELSVAHTKLQNGEEKRKALLDELSAAHTELQNGEGQRKALLDELSAAHVELQNGEGQRKALLDELSAAHTELQNGEGQRKALVDELSAVHTELQNGENKRKILLSELTDTQSKLQDEERQRRALQDQFNNILAESKINAEQRDSLQSELGKTRTELQNIEEHRKMLLSELSVANTELQNSEKLRKNLLSELNTAYMELTSGEEIRHSLQEELVKYRTELCAVNELQKTLQKELEKTQMALLECEEQRKALQSELDAARTGLYNNEEQRKALQSELDAARTGLHNGKEQRKVLQSDLDAAHIELQNGEEQRKVLQSELEKLRTALNEEHAKAEYLYYVYNELKKSWALRIFGRFAIRRRVKTAMQSIGQVSYQAGDRIFSRLPCSFSLQENCRDFLYSHFGGMLQNVKDYEEWHLKQEVRNEFLEQGDTGLTVPANLPLTSIVIPVYNNLKLTKKCLYSIYQINSKSPFEVIIVDDCSTEDIGSIKKDFPDVRIIRNEKNSGFLLTSNRGGAEASGEYLVFLNNDTEVLPGWLDELTTALYHHPEAGMIGSQLIHMSTRKLQESGNLICKNGEMLPLGRGESPDHPEFNFFREVDFSSAASIILRKKVFEEMRGFDTAYAPAYFEDPDLGLRMQKAGYKNYVMPLSRLLHQEMASYGSVLDERCQKNRQFFNNRWHDYLQKHALYETPASMQQMRQYAHPRLLYIDAEVPMADRGSGGMDAIFFMEYFIKRGYDVVFHGEYTPGYVPKYTTILLRMGVECIYLPHRKIWEYLASAGWMFNTVFVSRIYQARCFDRLLKKYCRQASYIFNTVDVHFVRELLEAELHNSDKLLKKAMTTKKYELQAAAAADATIVISNDELKLLEKEYHLGNIWHIPQARDIFGLAPNPNRHGAVFIGSAHPPNMDGLRYFHDEILPLLPEDFCLTIIGESLKKVMSESKEYKDLLDCRQFKFVGFVQDLGTVLNHALMTVAPLRYGAGTKGKVASSMAYGIPCVSSKFGTEGTGMVNRKNILIAATPREFADAIRELSRDRMLWRKLSAGGLEFLRQNYSKDKVEAKMDALMAHVSAHRQESHWASTPVIPKEEEETGED